MVRAAGIFPGDRQTGFAPRDKPGNRCSRSRAGSKKNMPPRTTSQTRSDTLRHGRGAVRRRDQQAKPPSNEREKERAEFQRDQITQQENDESAGALPLTGFAEGDRKRTEHTARRRARSRIPRGRAMDRTNGYRIFGLRPSRKPPRGQTRGVSQRRRTVPRRSP